MKFPYVLGIPTMVNEYLLAVSCTLIYLTITYGTRLLSFRVCVMGGSAPILVRWRATTGTTFT